jgi:hypothetical protein
LRVIILEESGPVKINRAQGKNLMLLAFGLYLINFVCDFRDQSHVSLYIA